MMGIGGSGMSGLAGLFSKSGWDVTGCDGSAVYPPASVILEELGIRSLVGFSPSHLDPAPDLLVVGNIVRETNAEDREARARGIARIHMADALHTHFIKQKTSVVVAGTHGKTTCTSMLVFLLTSMGEDPGFLVGGTVRDLGRNYAYGAGRYFVVEGDEYDCAWFDKQPKFLHYKPKYLLITNIEFDHADIYGSIDEIRTLFAQLIESLPPDGHLVYCHESPLLRELARHAPCTSESYAAEGDDGVSWTITDIIEGPGLTRFMLHKGGKDMGEFGLSVHGRHNVLNATGVLALLNAMGLPLDSAGSFLPSFMGAARRMQVMIDGPIVLIDDFAHHPTEIAATLCAARAHWPGRRLWALYEPKTQTSRRSVFQERTASALAQADNVVLLHPHDLDSIPQQERLDMHGLVTEIAENGRLVSHFHDVPELVQYMLEELGNRDELIVVMSAGSFGGAVEQLYSAISSRAHHRDT